MSKLLKYELRRMIWNRFFLCICAVLVFYGWLLLSNDVIQGIANTAPFSAWSFGYYLAHLTPIICIGELLMILLFASKKEKMVKTITSPTPFSKTSFLFVRSCVVLVAVLLLSVVVLVLGIAFSGVFFGEYPVVNLLYPFVVTVVPIFVFCIGTGMFLCKQNPLFLFIIGVILLLGFIPDFDLYGIRFYTDYPEGLKILDPGFRIPFWLAGKQIVILAVGVMFYILEWSSRRKREI